MARASKKKSKAGSRTGFSLFDEGQQASASGEEELPKDEAGRQKIKKQYVELLGIRLGKLKGRILNRERIDKNLEGVYFICVSCGKVCHNLEDGLIEDPENENNSCAACHEAAKAPPKATRAAAKKKKPEKKKAVRKKKR